MKQQNHGNRPYHVWVNQNKPIKAVGSMVCCNTEVKSTTNLSLFMHLTLKKPTLLSRYQSLNTSIFCQLQLSCIVGHWMNPDPFLFPWKSNSWASHFFWLSFSFHTLIFGHWFSEKNKDYIFTKMLNKFGMSVLGMLEKVCLCDCRNCRRR